MPRFDCRVVEARDLPRKGTIKPCPFVVLENDGTKGATPPAQYSSSPQFDSVFKFSPRSVDEPLIATIWNEGTCCMGDEQMSTLKIDLTKIGLIQGEVKDDWYTFPHQNGAAVRLRIVAHDFGWPPGMAQQQQHQHHHHHHHHHQFQQSQPQFVPHHHHHHHHQPPFDPNQQQFYGGGAPPPPPPLDNQWGGGDNIPPPNNGYSFGGPGAQDGSGTYYNQQQPPHPHSTGY